MVGRAALAIVALYGTFMWAGSATQATTARAPVVAHEAAHFKPRPQDPGGAFYNVRVKLVRCGRGEAILNANGHRYGFRCHIVGHGPGGGFPATEYCRKGSAGADGDVYDGMSTS
jgi:hypothetical protein